MMGATLPAISRWIEDHSAGRILVGLFLWRKYRRRRLRLPSRRILSASRSRHGNRELCGRRDQSRGCSASLLWRGRLVYEARDQTNGMQPRHARRRIMAGLLRDRALRPLRSGRRGYLDPHSVADARARRSTRFPSSSACSLTGLGSAAAPARVWRGNTANPRLRLGVCQLAAGARDRYGPHSCWPISCLTGSGTWMRRCRLASVSSAIWRAAPSRSCRRRFSGAPAFRSRSPAWPPETNGRDPGRLVGEVYGANTIGAIFGSLGFSLIFIPSFGYAAFRSRF